MTNYKYLLMSIYVVIITGCNEPVVPDPVIMHDIVYKTKIMYVPTTCNVKKPTCDFHGEKFTPTVKLLKCVVTQKKYIDTCLKYKKGK